MESYQTTLIGPVNARCKDVTEGVCPPAHTAGEGAYFCPAGIPGGSISIERAARDFLGSCTAQRPGSPPAPGNRVPAEGTCDPGYPWHGPPTHCRVHGSTAIHHSPKALSVWLHPKSSHYLLTSPLVSFLPKPCSSQAPLSCPGDVHCIFFALVSDPGLWASFQHNSGLLTHVGPTRVPQMLRAATTTLKSRVTSPNSHSSWRS